jgi:hypothetical protein
VAFNYFQEAQRARHDTIYIAFEKFSEQLSGDWEVRRRAALLRCCPASLEAALRGCFADGCCPCVFLLW